MIDPSSKVYHTETMKSGG